MGSFLRRICVVLLSCEMSVAVVEGQMVVAFESGVPGDGVPDVYYNPSGVRRVPTSVGVLEVAPGMLLFDTDDWTIDELLVGGPDVSTSGCSLCDGGNLPGAMADLSDASTWSVSYAAGTMEWVRQSPLTGNGFRGVAAFEWLDETSALQSWPADLPPILDFPDAGTGLADYGLGLNGVDFTRVFDQQGGLWNVQWMGTPGRYLPPGGADATGGFTLVTITIVPEPSCSGWMGMVGLGIVSKRRRQRGS